MLLAAVLAFIPVAAVDSLLGNYVRQRETVLLQGSLDNLSAEIAARADGAVGALDRILGNSPPLCTPAFIANIRDVLVENEQGV